MRNPKYFPTLRERFGVLPPSWQQTVSASIWLHAVSVGEVLAALPLIEELKKRNSLIPVFVSTTTLAGAETAHKRLDGIANGVFYAPFDVAWSVRRVLRRLRPSVVIVLETEIWPNLFNESRRLGCGLIIVNGRISDRALPRYRRFAPLFSTVLELCDRILTQSDEMTRRFIAAGAPAANVETAGNLKYDFAVPATPPNSFIDADHARPIWIAASTSADDSIVEEEFVIAAQRALPGWRLIVAPRKPERFDDVARRIANSGLRWTRRTALNDPQADVLLLDSIGELSGLFACAQVVFMGGTLAAMGGHNILEPAIFGKPVIAGPHMENFRDIAEEFERHQALKRISSGDQLRDAILTADPAMGERAYIAARERRGATARTVHAVIALYDSCYPSHRRPQPAHAFLWLLSQIWKVGSARDRDRKRKRMQRLPVPVVSVGNITTGGTGKTPVIIELTRDFCASNPGVLTRGYGRSTKDAVLLLNRAKPVSFTGDEAQLCNQGGRVPVGIDGNRYRAGAQLLAAADIGMLFLDDGFQHLQLHRDFDLVVIDGLHPFGGGDLLPLGRLREPIEGLARAHAFLLTRTKATPNTLAIESVLRHYNPGAPVFNARIAIRHWMGCDGKCLRPNELKSTAALVLLAVWEIRNPSGGPSIVSASNRWRSTTTTTITGTTRPPKIPPPRAPRHRCLRCGFCLLPPEGCGQSTCRTTRRSSNR